MLARKSTPDHEPADDDPDIGDRLRASAYELLWVSAPITIMTTVPFIDLAAGADRQQTQLSRGDATALSSHADDPYRRRATEPKPVSQDARQPALESARRRTSTYRTVRHHRARAR